MAGFTMKQEKKISKSFRLSPLVVQLISAAQRDKAKEKGRGKNAAPSEAEIIEECVYRVAAQNPEYRERIVTELRQDPRFAAVADLLSKVGDNTEK